MHIRGPFQFPYTVLTGSFRRRELPKIEEVQAHFFGMFSAHFPVHGRDDDLAGGGDPAFVHVASEHVEVRVTHTDVDVQIDFSVHAGDAAVEGRDLHGHVEGFCVIDPGACVKEAHIYVVGGSQALDAAQLYIFLSAEFLQGSGDLLAAVKSYYILISEFS